MRRIIALALACGLGAAGIVAAEETSGSWWSRTFTMPWTKSAEAKKGQKKDEPTPGPSRRERMSSADAALRRRQEVCLRLQEIALQTGDDELFRKAEELDQRAWRTHEATLARLRQPGLVPIETDTQKKEKRK